MFIKKGLKISFLIFICISLASCTIIRSKEENKNNELIPNEKLDLIIKNNVEPISIETFNGGKAFCDYKIIGSNKDGNEIKMYMLILAQEYFKEASELKKGVGGNFTAVLTLEESNGEYKFINCDISKAIEQEESINIFPEDIREKAKNITFSADSVNRIEERAREYFNK
ncbi:hypothetical protein [uncultured Clostridium sp.]|uniref:hypothetical protein n=1 Tax=uncultured Clostridium sp. TaxID=59620 RepID=UPI0025D34D69|nr:hypothetical protein [uncultured Clostridium sp.]